MMGLTIRDQRAFASGVLFLAFAIFFLVTALNYPAGTAARMGPGYFPRPLAIVLGPAIEENFRRAMVLSRGDVSVFLTSPLSAGLLAAAVIAVILIMLPTIRTRREEALQE